MNYKNYQNELKAFLKNKPSKEEIFLFLEECKNEKLKYDVSIKKATFSYMKDTHTIIALEVIESVLEKIVDSKFLKVVKNRYETIGDFTNSKKIEERCRRIEKRKIIDMAIDTFMKNKETHNIDLAFKELDPILNKYYYLERTILKKIHTAIKKEHLEVAKSLEKKIISKFNDIEFKPTY